MSTVPIYIIGGVTSILFMSSYLPDIIRAIRSPQIVGVTLSTPIIVMVALVGAVTTNLYFGNWPLAVNDTVCLVLNGVILVQRWRKLQRLGGEG